MKNIIKELNVLILLSISGCGISGTQDLSTDLSSTEYYVIVDKEAELKQDIEHFNNSIHELTDAEVSICPDNLSENILLIYIDKGGSVDSCDILKTNIDVIDLVVNEIILDTRWTPATIHGESVPSTQFMYLCLTE